MQSTISSEDDTSKSDEELTSSEKYLNFKFSWKGEKTYDIPVDNSCEESGKSLSYEKNHDLTLKDNVDLQAKSKFIHPQAAKTTLSMEIKGGNTSVNRFGGQSSSILPKARWDRMKHPRN